MSKINKPAGPEKQFFYYTLCQKMKLPREPNLTMVKLRYYNWLLFSVCLPVHSSQLQSPMHTRGQVWSQNVRTAIEYIDIAISYNNKLFTRVRRRACQ